MEEKVQKSRRARVLIVEDSKPIRMFLRRVVAQLDADVVGEGANGAEAVALHREWKPDLTLLDINMPVKDGRAALKEILGESPGARIVMITSVNSGPIVMECIESGASGYILKDADKAELIGELKSVLEAIPR